MQATETKIRIPKAPKTSREEKALKMFQTGKIATRTEDGYLVRGHNGNTYTVREETDGTFSCECGDFLWRHQLMCKHILFVRMVQDAENRHKELLSAKHDIHLHKEKMVVIC
jgi:hypothetical protein